MVIPIPQYKIHELVDKYKEDIYRSELLENMSSMFSYTEIFNQPLNKWNVSRVKDMSNMFLESLSFNQPLDLWNVSRVENMWGMIYNSPSFNQPLDQVKNMSWMFGFAKSYWPMGCIPGKRYVIYVL